MKDPYRENPKSLALFVTGKRLPAETCSSRGMQGGLRKLGKAASRSNVES